MSDTQNPGKNPKAQRSDKAADPQTPTNAAAGSGDNESEAPALVVTNVEELASAVSIASSEVQEKPVRMYTAKGGFKGPKGLESISNEQLAVMAACCMRQIALNGGESAHLMLGTKSRPGLISQFGPVALQESDEERKVSAYVRVAADLGITREPGESASAFNARVQKAFTGSRK